MNRRQVMNCHGLKAIESLHMALIQRVDLSVVWSLKSKKCQTEKYKLNKINKTGILAMQLSLD